MYLKVPFLRGDIIEDLYWIWVSRMNYLCYEVLEKLVDKYKSLERIWNLDFYELSTCNFLEKKNVDELLDQNIRKNLNKYLDYMGKNDIGIINCFDSLYPRNLRFIENRPIVLFYKGDINIVNNESVAIVGSRACTEYGRECAFYFSAELSRRNVNIISGLAIGIDAIAHTAALKSNGKTIAVIGNGLDNIYPSRNKQLANAILKKGGLILSEYIIGTKPFKWNFPRRNRIISGIADSVIVVEGSNKSGSLITAGYAANQGKEVWAIPGNIFSKNSEGTNQLIKDGANVLTEISDIVHNM